MNLNTNIVKNSLPVCTSSRYCFTQIFNTLKVLDLDPALFSDEKSRNAEIFSLYPFVRDQISVSIGTSLYHQLAYLTGSLGTNLS